MKLEEWMRNNPATSMTLKEWADKTANRYLLTSMNQMDDAADDSTVQKTGSGSQSAQPAYSSSASYPGYGSVSYTVSSGTGSTSQVTVTASGLGFGKTAEKEPAQSYSADAPAVILTGYDQDTNQNIKMTMKPESDISTRDTLKLATLMYLASTGKTKDFGVLQYVRANNLERHFRFETV